MMRECKRHSQPGGGVCARCLEERLSWLWRGESFRHYNEEDDAMEASTSAAPAEGSPSLASVRQQLQVLGVARRPSHHPGQSNEPPQNSKPIIEEWVAFHARRRGEGLEHETSSKSETSSGTEERRAQNPELRILMNAHKMRSQSLPLDFRSAEETAARVINECANEEDAYELEMYEAPQTEPERTVESEPQQRCFSPKWQSPKWVKVLASPMTSRNRVFPSRSKDEHMRKRSNKRGAPRLDSSDWGFSSEATTNGGSSPLWRGSSGMQQRSKSRSMFSWLQVRYIHSYIFQHLILLFRCFVSSSAAFHFVADSSDVHLSLSSLQHDQSKTVISSTLRVGRLGSRVVFSAQSLVEAVRIFGRVRFWCIPI